MTFDLESFGPGVESKAVTWIALGLAWQIMPIDPNYGKPVVVASFQSAAWIGDMLVWITGEAELGTLRRADGWIVNKHYDLASADDLGTALDEVAALIADSSVPHGALTAREQRSQ